jgi:hypothetical protein
MKKKLYLITTITLSAAMLFLSSCLKDKTYVDFSKVGTIVNFPLGGTPYFSQDAITSSADTITETFVVNISSPTAPTTATNITLAVDNTVVTSYDQANPAVAYQDVPTTATIAAGARTAQFSVTFYKSLLDPSKSYMLPIRITNAGGLNISGNQGIMYYHFIGNDFAGTYSWDYTRIPAAGNFVGGTAVLSPVTPTQFEAFSGYYTGTIRYEVTFTKNSDGTYSDFNVALNSDDITNILTPNGITVTVQPTFKSDAANSTIAGIGTSTIPGPLTFAQAETLFDLTYTVVNSSGQRIVEDHFYK